MNVFTNKYLNFLSDAFKFILYTAAAVLFFTASEDMSKLMCVAIMAVLMLWDDRFILVSIGCGNCMPDVFGITPIVIVTVLILLKLLIKPSTRMFRWTTREVVVYILIIALSCHLLLGFFSHGDSTVAGNLATILVFSTVIIAFNSKTRLSLRQYLNAFLYGLGIVIFIGLLISIKLPGFQSQHIFRLSIGERSDPNSTAFLAVLFCIAIFASIIFDTANLRYLFFKCSLFVAGLFVLLSTGSRGGFYSLILGVFFAVSSRIFRSFWRAAKPKPKGYYFITVFFIVLISGIAIVYISVNNQWQIFEALFSRINIWTDDGSRLSLIELSFELVRGNPLFGIGLKNFESVATHVPHNVYLDFLVSGGWIAMILFIMIAVCGIDTVRRNAKRSANPKIAVINILYLTALIDLFTYSANNEKTFYLLLFLVLFANRKRYKIFKRTDNTEESVEEPEEDLLTPC